MSDELLLDTHVLLWMLLDPDRIPEATRHRLRAAPGTLHVSAATAWEVATKARLGKLAGAEAVMHGYREHLVRLRAQELAITGHHALTAGALTWEHRDPFDRMIVTQAMIESLPLVTADAVVTAFPGIRTVWG